MKKNFAILLTLLTAILSSCHSDSQDEPTVDTFISAGGLLNIQLKDYASEGIDSVKMYDDNLLLGKCKLTTDGIVLMQLSQPGNLKKIGGMGEIYVSDTTALALTLKTLNAYNVDGIQIGTISCDNVYENVANEVGRLMYCDRDLKIKGSTESASTNPYIPSSKTIYDMTLKKGWNVIVVTSDVDKNTFSTVQQYSTTIPSDLQWRYW